MNNTKTYTPRLGEDITTCIENALSKSITQAAFKRCCDVKFSFNGIEMEVNASAGKSDHYLAVWKEKCKERSEAYKASPEYKEAKEKQEIATRTLQGEMDVHIEQLCLNNPDTTRLYFLSWLKRFVELSDHTGVTFSKQRVFEKFELLDYKEDEYVGWKGEWTTEISVKYITGQVISCLNSMGCIPPVAITMCEKVLSGKGL